MLIEINLTLQQQQQQQHNQQRKTTTWTSSFSGFIGHDSARNGGYAFDHNPWVSV